MSLPQVDDLEPVSVAVQRVAVIDDDVVLRDVLLAMVSCLGYESVEIGHNADVVGELRDAEVDAIFLDHQMSPQTGLEVAAALRAAGQSTPICMLTGHSRVAETALERGIDFCLLKPVLINDLSKVLSEMAARDEVV